MPVERDVAIPMRDGVVLRADVYLPRSQGPVPAIVSRTPYDRGFALTPPAALDPERATEAGYALVIQDVRGQHSSEGEFRPFAYEGPDGYDTVEWVAAQSWCSGAVGLAGRSYPAANQWRAAIARPPHLRAIFPTVVGSDYYDGWLYRGGAFELGFNLFWVHMMSDSKGRGSLDAHFRHLPVNDPPLLADSPARSFYREWLEHTTYDAHWRELSIRNHYGDVEVPALNVGGWYDIFAKGTLENYVRLRAEAGSEHARSETRLLMGPWAHGSAYGAYPDHQFKEFAPRDRVDLTALGLAFFDRHLRGADDDGWTAPIRIFVMGENRWREEHEWPLARARGERWFLRAEGALSPQRPADERPDEYVHDPRDPAPTLGGPTSLPAKFMRQNAGPMDQSPLDGRSDVLGYTSAPLESPVEVTGPLELVLYAASSARDTDWIGKLCDVDPGGAARILAEGVLRARYREGLDQPRLLEPDQVYEFRVDLGVTSNVFLPGHRIRLYLTSSSFPRLDRNAGSGKPVGEDREEDLRPARQRIFHDAQAASHLLLPVVTA